MSASGRQVQFEHTKLRTDARNAAMFLALLDIAALPDDLCQNTIGVTSWLHSLTGLKHSHDRRRALQSRFCCSVYETPNS